MSYDWRPSATRSATTDPSIVTSAARARAEQARDERARDDAPSDLSVAAAAGRFLAAAEAGTVLNRSGRPYRPSAMRDLRGILEYHVVPALGDVRLRAVRRPDVQSLVDQLGDEGLSESRIRSVVSALRALFGYAIEQGWAEHNPADALVMPDGAEPAAPAAETRGWAEDAARMVQDQAAGVRDRVGELWEDRPRWEDRPARNGQPPDRRLYERRTREEDRPARNGGPPAQRRGSGRTSDEDRAWSWDEPPARDRDGGYEPIVQLPERILSFALRAALVLFVILALVALVESA
jgi:hypothetical protein